MTCGIYRLTMPSGSFYIGSSKDIEKRFRQHLADFRSGRHCNLKMQASLAKTPGVVALSVLIVCREEDLLMYEQRCINGLKPNLNISQVAGKVDWTEEIRAKVGATQKGRKRSLEAIEKQREALVGRKFSDEHRANISAAQIGRKQSAETVEKRRAKATGKKRTPEQRARISEGMKRRKEMLS